MAEYIEREAAIKAIFDSDPNGIRRTLGFNVGQIEEALRAVPAVSVPQWISVTDRLPKAGENPVLAGNAELGIVNMAWYHRSKGIWETPSGFSCSFTHWMPLPEPPKGESEQ